MTFFSCRLQLPLPSFHVVYPVFFLNLATKKNFIWVSPLDSGTRDGPPPPTPPSNATEHQRIKFNTIDQSVADPGVIDDIQPISPAHFRGGQDCRPISQSWRQRPISNLQQ